MSHFHEDLNHYHLLVTKPGSRIQEISEVFRHSNKERGIFSATVGEIKGNIHSKFDDDDEEIKNNNFYLTWKGKKLEPDTLKIRDIEVDGERLPLHKQNINNPIEIHIGDGNDVPSIVSNDASASDDENPDYNETGIQNKQRDNLAVQRPQTTADQRTADQRLADQRIANQLKIDENIQHIRAQNLEKRRLREQAKREREEAEQKTTKGGGKKSKSSKSSKSSKKRFVKKQKNRTRSK